MTTTAAGHDEQHRLTAVQGLAALSLDALSSVAYGPEAILGPETPAPAGRRAEPVPPPAP